MQYRGMAMVSGRGRCAAQRLRLQNGSAHRSLEKYLGNSRQAFLLRSNLPFQLQGGAIEDFWSQPRAVVKKVNNTFMIETEDIGNLRDIHPHNKFEIGKHLADTVIKSSQ